jgi:hypothetical protein
MARTTKVMIPFRYGIHQSLVTTLLATRECRTRVRNIGLARSQSRED